MGANSTSFVNSILGVTWLQSGQVNSQILQITNYYGLAPNPFFQPLPANTTWWTDAPIPGQNITLNPITIHWTSTYVFAWNTLVPSKFQL
jgi:hypothetical protein